MPGIVVNVYDIADTAKMTEEIVSSDIFANATIVGMKPMDDQSVVKDLSAFRPGLVVCDAVYNPAETKLLREAKRSRMYLHWRQGNASVAGSCCIPVIYRYGYAGRRSEGEIFS